LIQFVDEAIEALLRREVPLPEAAVDISFVAPDRAWGAAVSRPTVNVFLWDVRRNAALSSTGLGQRYTDGQHAVRRPKDPVIDLRYLVTAWAGDQRDEHQLLGSVLRCVLANSTMPQNALPEALAGSPFVKLALATEDVRVPAEFWSSLDGRLKPGLQVVVTLPVSVFHWVPAGPPATAVSLGVGKVANGAAPSVEAGAGTAGPLLRRRRKGGTLTMEGKLQARTGSTESHAQQAQGRTKEPEQPSTSRG
jgi:hypothetical protein